MTKEQFTKAINALRNISINFKIDYFIFAGKCYMRGLIISEEDVDKTKNILEKDILKNFKFKKSKAWYLGDEKTAIYMQLKDKIEISIAELEEYQVNNYA